MISSESLANDIFKILKGSNYAIEVFTDEGESTVNPELARRFYVPEHSVMINLDETENRRELKVSVGGGTQVEAISGLLSQLKNLANRNIVEYTLKSYSKSITPKDFDYQAQKVRDMNKIEEAISPAYGSTKSSYQKLESAKLIIKHNKPVNEEQRGSRSRNIQAIYIENAEGERYKLPTNNLAGGRAMLRHVKEGGTPYDSFGEHIIEQCNELKKLKEFKRYSEKNSLVNEDTADIVEAVAGRIASIRETLNKLKGSKNYASTLEAFESRQETLEEEDYSDIKDRFTVSYFDENVEGALPYVNALIKEMQAIKERDSFANDTITSLADAINSMDTVRLKKGVDIANDPENPLRNKRNMSPQELMGAVMQYFATVIDGGKDQDELAVLLARANDVIDSISDRAILNKSAKAIRELMSKSKPAEAKEDIYRDATAKFVETIEKSIEKYDIDTIFA